MAAQQAVSSSSQHLPVVFRLLRSLFTSIIVAILLDSISPAFMLRSSEVVLLVVYGVASRKDSNVDGGMVTLVIVTIDLQGSRARHGRAVEGSSVADAPYDCSNNDMRLFLLAKCEDLDGIDVVWTLETMEKGVVMLGTVCWLYVKPSPRPLRRRVM